MICTLLETHYLINGTLVAGTKVMIEKQFEFETGEGFNCNGREILCVHTHAQKRTILYY